MPEGQPRYKRILLKLSGEAGVGGEGFGIDPKTLQAVAEDIAQVVNAALTSQPRFEAMKEFFAGVGEGHTAGIWEDVPQDKPEFRAEYRRRLDKEAKKRKAEEMV